MRVAKMLIEEHYLKRELNDEMSEKVFDRYLTYLDFNHVYFLQSDIDQFMAEKDNIDDYLRAGDVRIANRIFDVFLTRVEARIARGWSQRSSVLARHDWVRDAATGVWLGPRDVTRR